MPTSFDLENAMLRRARYSGGKGHGFSLAVVFIFLVLTFTPSAFATLQLTLSTSGGVTINGAYPAYTASYGTVTMNGLAIGATNVPPIRGAALGNGAIYYTTLQVTGNGGFGNRTYNVKAYVSTPFTGNAASAMIVWGCASACTTAGSYSAIGTSQLAETTLATLNKNTTSAVVGLAIFLPDNDGTTAYTNTTAAGVTVSIDLIQVGNTTPDDTNTLQLQNETVQEAVQLTLGTATSGRTISAGSDYTLDFGTVNALGIGPGANLTTSAATNGIIYSTPYNLLPVFTDFSHITATITVCVSMTFTNSTVLVLEKSATGSAGSFSNITTCGNGADTLTGTGGDRSTILQYLGLFVSNVNGATAYTGGDSASLKYTLTVP